MALSFGLTPVNTDSKQITESPLSREWTASWVYATLISMKNKYKTLTYDEIFEWLFTGDMKHGLLDQINMDVVFCEIIDQLVAVCMISHRLFNTNCLVPINAVLGRYDHNGSKDGEFGGFACLLRTMVRKELNLLRLLKKGSHSYGNHAPAPIFHKHQASIQNVGLLFFLITKSPPLAQILCVVFPDIVTHMIQIQYPIDSAPAAHAALYTGTEISALNWALCWSTPVELVRTLAAFTPKDHINYRPQWTPISSLYVGIAQLAVYPFNNDQQHSLDNVRLLIDLANPDGSGVSLANNPQTNTSPSDFARQLSFQIRDMIGYSPQPRKRKRQSKRQMARFTKEYKYEFERVMENKRRDDEKKSGLLLNRVNVRLTRAHPWYVKKQREETKDLKPEDKYQYTCHFSNLNHEVRATFREWNRSANDLLLIAHELDQKRASIVAYRPGVCNAVDAWIAVVPLKQLIVEYAISTVVDPKMYVLAAQPIHTDSVWPSEIGL